MLLPRLPRENIIRAANTFISNALELKRALTDERAVYRFYWVQGGDAIDATSMQTTDQDRGAVGLCMFPGMMRNVKEDEGQLTFNVVKAMTKSEMR